MPGSYREAHAGLEDARGAQLGEPRLCGARRAAGHVTADVVAIKADEVAHAARSEDRAQAGRHHLVQIAEQQPRRNQRLQLDSPHEPMQVGPRHARPHRREDLPLRLEHSLVDHALVG
eukprot:scaffold32788_cov42-Phaeocystis_antarctica.AAC.1